LEEALYEITPMRQFARLTLGAPIPEDTTIMNFRHLLEKHQLAPAILAVINGYLQEKGLSLRQGTIVDATIIHAPSSTKNKDSERDPELLHGQENAVYADAGYTGVEKREEHENRDLANRGSAQHAFQAEQTQPVVQSQAQDQVLQSADTCQGRAPVSGHQAPVWLRESTLSWTDEKHGPSDHAIRPIGPVDGSKKTYGFG